MARKPGVLRSEKMSCLQDYVMYIPLEWVDIQVYKESLLVRWKNGVPLDEWRVVLIWKPFL